MHIWLYLSRKSVMLDRSKNRTLGEPGQGITGCKYIKIEVEEESFRKAFEKVESAGVTSLSILCFNDYSIAQINKGLPVEQLGDILHLG